MDVSATVLSSSNCKFNMPKSTTLHTITITPAQYGNALAGNYTDTVTITISP